MRILALQTPDEVAATGANGAPAPNGGGAAPLLAPPAAQTKSWGDDPAFHARLRSVKQATEREARQKLLAELGIEDPEKFKQERELTTKQLADLRSAEEERKRASMTQEDKLRADLKAAQDRIAAIEAARDEAETDAAAARFESLVNQAFQAHIDPEMMDVAQRLFVEHGRKLPKSTREKFGKADAEAWAKELAEKRPKFARAAPASAAPAKKPEPVRRPLSNGSSPRAAAPPGPAKIPGSAKSARDMTPAEYKEALRKHGVRMR